MKIELQACYVLHSRPYRDTSLIVDILSREHGRLSVLARGYRQSPHRGRVPLQPFVPYLLSWQGRGELKTLTQAEIAHPRAPLLGNHLYSALYCNELIVRLLPAHDAHPEIYDCYEELLGELGGQQSIEPSLRRFELSLLEFLGYGIGFEHAGDDAEAIAANALYRYFPETGFVAVAANQRDEESFSGEDILAIHERDFREASTLKAAKRLLRIALAPHLGNKPLRSREVFRKRPS